MLKSLVAVIIVTYNSEKHIYKAMECLREQSIPADKILIVDTGSKDPSYLNVFKANPNVEVILAEKNAGFCKGNNLGLQYVPKDYSYVLFLNPDAFLKPSFIELALETMENEKIGALTGLTYGYNMEEDRPSGRYDTTGVFKTWYGRWFDRDQGRLIHEKSYRSLEEVPAICGAVLFCRKKAIDEISLRQGEVFDNHFYMYKEDVDVSVRLRKKGWKLMLNPKMAAYHCRGWTQDRSLMPRRFRKLSAKNEIRVNFRSKNLLGILYSTVKYTAVKVFDL